MTKYLRSFPLPPETVKFSRKKSKWILGSILYKINRISNLLLGKIFTIRLLLNLEMLIWRLAYENSYRYFGQQFTNEVYNINEKLLKEYGFPGCSVIDIGCGQGRLSRMASACIAGSVLGIDYDRQSIDIAIKNNSNEKINYVCGNVLSLEIKEKFDLAIMAGVLEHLDDAQDYLKSMHKIANRIIIEVPDIEANQLNIIRFNLGTRIYSDSDHIREYTFEALMAQMIDAKWKVIYSIRRGQMMTVVADKG